MARDDERFEEAGRGPRGDRYDDDRIRQQPPNWIEQQFKNTNIVLLVIFSVCCSLIALVFGILGLAMSKDPEAKQKALVVTIIAGISFAVGVVWQVVQMGAQIAK